MSIEQEISKNRTSLMGVSMLSIMLFHQSWIWGWNPFWAFFHFYGNWGVDVFFFVSGFGLYYSFNKDERIIPFYKRRLVRLLPLCISCGLFRYVVDHILPVGRGGYPTGVHEISSDWMTILSLDKWFITVILVYYFLMPLLFKVIKQHGKRVLPVVYLFALIGGFSTIDGLSLYTTRLPSFCLGVFLAAGRLHMSNFWKLFGFGAIAMALLYKGLIMARLVSLPDHCTYLILSMGIVVLCGWLADGISRFSYNSIGNSIAKLINFVGCHSLEIYLLHEFVYRYTYRFLIDSPIPLFLQMLTGMMASISIAYLFSLGTKRLLYHLNY